MKSICLNCNESLSGNAQYCSACGQSIKESTLSIGQILKDALSTLFNLDSRLFATLRNIFQPSKLTIAYVEGRRKQYVNPVRLFLFFIITLLSLILLIANVQSSDSMSKKLIEDAYKSELVVEFDSLSSVYSTDSSDAVLDSVKTKLFKTKENEKLYFFSGTGSFAGINLSHYKITKVDAVNLSPDEILQKYKIEDFKEKLLVKQIIKFANDTSGGIKYIVKNFTWVVLLLILFSSFILKLLYIRKNIFVIEHLILMLYCHVLLFLLLIFSLILQIAGTDIQVVFPIAFCIYFLFLFLSFYKYYKQSFIRTFFKYFAFNIMYGISFLFLAIIVSLLSVAIY